MKEFLRSRKKPLLLTLLALLALLLLWYSRPVDVHTLLGKQQIRIIHVTVISYENGSRWSLHDPSRSALLEGDQARQVMEKLEDLRFVRFPLGSLRQLLAGRDTAGGQRVYWYQLACAQALEDWNIRWPQFSIDRWFRGSNVKLLLFAPQGREQGQELGTLLWELAEEGKEGL